MRRNAADTRLKPALRHRLLTALLAGCLAGGLAVTPPAEGGALGKALIGRLLARDLARDAATAARPLARGRLVQRFTSARQAAKETRLGLAPNKHLTPRAARGRPLGPQSAQRRYGLPRPPQVRETVRLPAGQPVRHNKALGGEPGRGELTSPRALPKGSVIRVVPLQ